MAAKLLARQAFTAWGKAYAVGDVVDPTDWPSGTLANRLSGGDVGYADTPDAPEKVKKP